MLVTEHFMEFNERQICDRYRMLQIITYFHFTFEDYSTDIFCVTFQIELPNLN